MSVAKREKASSKKKTFGHTRTVLRKKKNLRKLPLAKSPSVQERFEEGKTKKLEKLEARQKRRKEGGGTRGGKGKESRLFEGYRMAFAQKTIW